MWRDPAITRSALFRPLPHPVLTFFFFNDTATTEIYTLSLHDALPILSQHDRRSCRVLVRGECRDGGSDGEDRKSTRLNSSHGYISYAVFCLKKKNMGYDPPPAI